MESDCIMARRNVPLHDMMRLSMSATMMMMEAQTVITMRLWGMAGFWNVGPGENQLMWQEKAQAAQQSGQAAAMAAIKGATPGQVALAAIKPVRRKTKANVSRLARRGPVKDPL